MTEKAPKIPARLEKALDAAASKIEDDLNKARAVGAKKNLSPDEISRVVENHIGKIYDRLKDPEQKKYVLKRIKEISKGMRDIFEGKKKKKSVKPKAKSKSTLATTVEKEVGADDWIIEKREEINNLIAEIETKLRIDRIKPGDSHNKDNFIESSFNSGIEKILADSAKRAVKTPVDAAKYQAFDLEILGERDANGEIIAGKEGIRWKFFEKWGVSVDKSEELLNVSKMTLRELADYILTKELVFWTGEHEQWTDENDRKVVDAFMQRLWKDKDKISGVTDDIVVGEKDFEGDDLRYADLEVREIVSDLQILGMFGLLNEKGENRRDDGVAEGRIDKLPDVLATLQVSKERLNETTFAHPRYGLILYEMLRRMKDQPALRKGAVPKLKRGELPPGFGRAPVNDRIVMRNGVKLVLYGDRFKENFDGVGNPSGHEVIEYTETEDGDTLLLDYEDTPDDPVNLGEKTGFIREAVNDRVVERNNMDTLLVGDRLNKIVDENGKEIGAKWYDFEDEEGFDEPLYEFDPRFSYETLASDTGKDILKQYAAYLLELIEEQRQEEADARARSRPINQSKIHFKELLGFKFPDPADGDLGKKDIDRLKMYARFLFFSFPFLTNILAVRQEKTQTPAHGFGNKDVPFVWIFSMLGLISHKSQRYANSDNAYYYMLKYFQPLEEGHYGAGGEARRLNQVRDLVIKYDQVYSDDDDVVGVVPQIPYGSSVFHTALSMLANATKDTSALMGKGRLYDGSVLRGTLNKPVYLGLGGKVLDENGDPYKKQEPYNFGLLYTSIRAWDALSNVAVENLPEKLTLAQIAEGRGGKNKSLISEKYGDNVGQAKMSDSSTPEKAKVPHLKEYTHLDLAADEIWDTVQRIFRAYAANSIEARIKLYEELEKGFIHTASVGGLSSGDSAKVLTRVLERMSSPSKSGKLYAEGINGFKGMNPCLAYREATVDGIRGKQVFEYVEALWNYKHSDVEGNVVKEFPFKFIGDGGQLGAFAYNRGFVRQALDPDPEIELYKSFLRGWRRDKGGQKVKVALPEPIERVNLEKHDK